MWVCMTMEFNGIVLVYLVHVKLYRLCRSISQPTSPTAYLSRMAVGEVVGDPDSVSCIGVGPFLCALVTGTFLCPSTRELHRRQSVRHPAPCITSPQHHLLRTALCTSSSPQHHLLRAALCTSSSSQHHFDPVLHIIQRRCYLSGNNTDLRNCPAKYLSKILITVCVCACVHLCLCACV